MKHLNILSLLVGILFQTIDLFITNDPILIASPYPFNTSKSSSFECFSNDQGIILSLTIIATMFNTTSTSSLKTTEENIIHNGSIVLTIPILFNYSQLYSKIECRSKYHYGQHKFSQLEVFSVAEIPGKDFLSMSSSTNQLATIHCLTYGTNVLIHWDFTPDLTNKKFSSLPFGIRITYRFILNDTLIIDHVSYSDHHGYYRCNATNQFRNQLYEDKRVFHLTVKKGSIWIPIVIVCVAIGLAILLLILCSKYCQKRKQRLERKSLSNENDSEVLPIDQKNVLTLSRSAKSQISSISIERERREPQFVLGNPFLDPNVQSIL
ncbi:hypothetical protein I4U23_017622 [Adineta vaga]|nr:hypothetical protein I4U23_017622 [Adineta vaga]